MERYTNPGHEISDVVVGVENEAAVAASFFKCLRNTVSLGWEWFGQCQDSSDLAAIFTCDKCYL